MGRGKSTRGEAGRGGLSGVGKNCHPYSSTIGISRNSYLKLINSVTTCHLFFFFIDEIDQEEREILGPNHFSLYVLQALEKEAHDQIESNEILHFESEVQKEGYPNTKDFSACALYFL